MNEELEPLPPDVRGLLDRAKGHYGPPPAVEALLRAQVVAPLVAGLARPHPSAKPSLHPMKALLRGKLAVAVASFGVGAGGGAVVAARHYAALPPRVERIEVRVPAPSQVAAPLPAPPAKRPVARPAKPVVPGPTPAPDEALTAERALLERGRTALTRGDPAGALAAVGEHARRFPEGELAEEREALRVQALVAQGRAADAKEAFERFQVAHPKSLMIQALRRELQSP